MEQTWLLFLEKHALQQGQINMRLETKAANFSNDYLEKVYKGLKYTQKQTVAFL